MKNSGTAEFNGEYMQISFNVPQTYRIAGLLAAVTAAVAEVVILCVRKIRRTKTYY